jgi:hypothetical protein
MGAERTDRHMTKLIVAFRSFAKTPTNEQQQLYTLKT